MGRRAPIMASCAKQGQAGGAKLRQMKFDGSPGMVFNVKNMLGARI